MPRQDSTTEQVESVAQALEGTHPDAARKLRENNVVELTPEEYQEASRIAVELGCYDAHDNIRRAHGRMN